MPTHRPSAVGVSAHTPLPRGFRPGSQLYGMPFTGSSAAMPWRDTPGGGFTAPEVQPWLPFGDLSAFNVHDQRDDPTSMLTLTRDLIAVRRRDAPGLQTGPYRSLDAPPGAWVWSRGDRIVVALNMASEDVVVSGIAGTVRVGTDAGRQGQHLGDGIRLRGWEAVVVERDDP